MERSEGKGRILVIEDDESIRELIQLTLGTVGFEVAAADDAVGGLGVLESGADLVLLDLGLPDRDGLRILPRVRERGIPVIVVTARDSLNDKVRGLEAGADDYIVKPFETLELIARVRAVLRRFSRDVRRHTVAGMEVDADARTVSRGGERIPLARREFDLLLCLVEHRGIALSRGQLLELAWGCDASMETRTVDVHVQRLREKLATGAIATVPGTGYRLDG
jgi:two-component system, OmpR family, alkaline phosphatase synthesis response regulator PhoP